MLEKQSSSELPRDIRSVPLQVMQPKRSQVIIFGPADTVVTNDRKDEIIVIRLVATENCHIEISENPVATTNSMFLPAGVVEYFYLDQDQELAVIQHTTSGRLFISEMG